jgi:peptidoglycan/xylan/chitin deacetylase (PgdA/CDA1 family)
VPTPISTESAAIATVVTTMPADAPPPPTTTPPPRPVPAPAQSASPHALEIDRGNLDRREIALTFDCGATASGTAEILAILREAGVRTTWFMIGDWVRANPELSRQIAAEHEVAHHSDTHPDYPSLTDAQVIADLEQGEQTFLEVMGVSTRPLWRAPSGARDNRVLAAAARAGWPLHIFWTIGRDEQGPVNGDSGDWRPFTPEQVASNMLRAAAFGNGVITVSHCDSEQTRLVLADVLRAYKEQGLRVVTVSEVLR